MVFLSAARLRQDNALSAADSITKIMIGLLSGFHLVKWSNLIPALAEIAVYEL